MVPDMVPDGSNMDSVNERLRKFGSHQEMISAEDSAEFCFLLKRSLHYIDSSFLFLS
jgi:hypothetical protein